jgi:hypothetical protein
MLRASGTRGGSEYALPLSCRWNLVALGTTLMISTKCEYLVGVEWRKTLPLSEAKTFPGVFANQNIVCKLRDSATIDFFKGIFPVDERAKTPAASASMR